jgi:Resolvase, N terminal domain/Helix-turn-helix domain of resolvase
VVTVTRIDRLARSTFDLFGIVKRIVDAKAQFRSLAEPWADTGTSTGRLMLAVLGGLADVERDLIRTRTAEGRARAKAQGKHMGRPPSLTPAQQKEAIRRRAQGATLDELARSYNVSRATISRLALLTHAIELSLKAFADHSVATGKPPGKEPKQHDLSGWYKLALQYGLRDEPSVADNIDILNDLHLTHYTRYPQHRPTPIPDASVIAGSTVEYLIFTFTQSINPR